MPALILKKSKQGSCLLIFEMADCVVVQDEGEALYQMQSLAAMIDEQTLEERPYEVPV